MKSIIEQMPEGKEKEQAKQGYENLKTFKTIADALANCLEIEQ